MRLEKLRPKLSFRQFRRDVFHVLLPHGRVRLKDTLYNVGRYVVLEPVAAVRLRFYVRQERPRHADLLRLRRLRLGVLRRVLRPKLLRRHYVGRHQVPVQLEQRLVALQEPVLFPQILIHLLLEFRQQRLQESFDAVPVGCLRLGPVVINKMEGRRRPVV